MIWIPIVSPIWGGLKVLKEWAWDKPVPQPVSACATASSGFLPRGSQIFDSPFDQLTSGGLKVTSTVPSSSNSLSPLPPAVVPEHDVATSESPTPPSPPSTESIGPDILGAQHWGPYDDFQPITPPRDGPYA